eukprot:g57596.t1
MYCERPCGLLPLQLLVRIFIIVFQATTPRTFWIIIECVIDDDWGDMDKMKEGTTDTIQEQKEIGKPSRETGNRFCLDPDLGLTCNLWNVVRLALFQRSDMQKVGNVILKSTRATGVRNAQLLLPGNSGGLSIPVRRFASESKKWTETDKRRMMYRCKQRGQLELDLIIGSWAQNNLMNLTDQQLNEFQKIVDQENPDLMRWLVNRDPLPEEFKTGILPQLVHYTHQEEKTWRRTNGNHPGAAARISGGLRSLNKQTLTAMRGRTCNLDKLTSDTSSPSACLRFSQ